jgi:hypothetical protein
MILHIKSTQKLIFFVTGGGVGSGSWYQERSSGGDSGNSGAAGAEHPYFQLEGVALNVTAVEGRRAELECGVGNLRDRRVSWIRKERHPVVLSSGTVVFTSDSRVSASIGGHNVVISLTVTFNR